MLENVGRQVRAAILGAAIRPLLQVWEPSVGQVRLPLGGKHKEPSEAFGNKRSNFQSCQENSEPPTDKVMTARKRTLKPARNRFLRDLIRGAGPRLTASPSQLGIFAKLRKNGVPKKARPNGKSFPFSAFKTLHVPPGLICSTIQEVDHRRLRAGRKFQQWPAEVAHSTASCLLRRAPTGRLQLPPHLVRNREQRRADRLS